MAVFSGGCAVPAKAATARCTLLQPRRMLPARGGNHTAAPCRYTVYVRSKPHGECVQEVKPIRPDTCPYQLSVLLHMPNVENLEGKGIQTWWVGMAIWHA